MSENIEPSDNDQNSNDTLDQEREELHLEYKECASLSRFVMGLRFSFFATFVTFFVVLMVGYNHVWAAPKKYGPFQPWLLASISFFGCVVATFAWVIEIRNLFISSTCEQHAEALERRMKIDRGLYHRLRRRGAQWLRFPATETYVVAGFYNITFCVWMVILVYSIVVSVVHLVR